MKTYLDAVSTTAVDEQVLAAYKKLLDEYYCNSDALYDDGVAIYDMQEKSRELISGMLGVRKTGIIFTSGASEANSLAIKGAALAQPKRHLITSIYEHSSVYNSFRQLESEFGFHVTYIYPDENGQITPAEVENEIREDTFLVSIMMVNNEIGALNDVEAIGKAVHKHPGVLFHSDITQALGKVPICLDNIDMASFSAHKIHGLKGSGALYKREHIKVLPLINGGQQEFSLRGGTSNALVNIVLARTLRIALEKQEQEHERLQAMHDQLLNGLQGIATINYDKGLCTLINISTPLTSEVLLNALNDKGIMVSSKSTCGSRKNEANRTLRAMNIDEDHAIRVSFDHSNTSEEIDYFINSLKEILNKYV